MYESYFGLSERPFSIAPDPQYLYMSERHREAMAHLMYGVGEGGGFVQLTGEVGTGKTTLCRSLLSQLPEDVDVALLLNPRLSGHELMQVICDELGIKYRRDATPKQLHDKLNDYLLKSFSDGRSTVLILDEAQLLDRDVLEQVRLLTNLETTKAKLLQIILIGQPELADLLARNDLRQLSQRITARYHLDALERDEVVDYVAYRLGVAGCKQALFSKQALARVYKHSGGVPRIINVICDHAMLAAYSKDKYVVDAAMVDAAAKEVLAAEDKPRNSWNWYWLAPVAPVMALLALASWMLGWWEPSGDVPGAVAPVAQSIAVPPAEPVMSVDSGPDAPDAVLTDDSALLADDLSMNVVETEPRSSFAEEVITPSYSPQPNMSAADLAVVEEADVLPAEAIVATALIAGEGVATEERLTAVLQQHGGETTREAAFTELLSLWGTALSVDDGPDPCLRVGRAGLDCLPGTGGWNQLVSRDRPAIISLTDGPHNHSVVLAGLADDTALLHLGGQEHRVPVEELLNSWTGDSLTLWQPPVPSRVFAPGSVGPDVAWLRTRLNEIADIEGIGGTRLDEINPAYDQALSARVSAFQYRHGLNADGIAGAETMLRMNSVGGRGTIPSLVIQDEPAGGS